MKKAEELKQVVKDKYADIALAGNRKNCGCGCSDEPGYSIMSQDYSSLDGYMEDADLKLGCGIPTEYADIKAGDRILDLGSGAGNDCFVARSIVGESGSVTGLDFTDEMLEKARLNNEKMGFRNVAFVKGDIEDIPLPDDTFDVVISNCVLNLVPEKEKAFSEIKRVLKEGGHFCVSDIVLKGELPDELREAASLYAGCISGALQKDDYLRIIRSADFRNVEVKLERIIDVPNEILLPYVPQGRIDEYRNSGAGVFSITVVGTR